MIKQSQSSLKNTFFKSLICLIFIYLLGHLTPFLSVSSNSIILNLSFQTLAYAQDEDEEDEEEVVDEKVNQDAPSGNLHTPDMPPQVGNRVFITHGKNNKIRI